MKNFLCLIICMSLLTIGTTAFAQRIKIYGHQGSLMAMNTTKGDIIHLFVAVEAVGCNGSLIKQPVSRYIVQEGVDFVNNEDGSSTHYDSFYRKISHWDHHQLYGGEKRILYVPRCTNGSVNYQFKSINYQLSAESWKFIKAKCLSLNPNCAWAK